jgi:HAMP domain-containing protein
MEELILSQGKLAATNGAKMFSTMLDDAIDNGYLLANDVFDQNYEEIKGYDFGAKPKYHTKYDFYTDRVMLGFQDQFLETPGFIYAVGSDVNGYVPTHNSKNMHPMTGDPAIDLLGNRTKRKYTNPVELARSRNLEPFLIQFYKRDTGAHLWDVSAPVFVKGKHWGCFCVGISIDDITKRKNALLLQLAFIFGILGVSTVGLIFVMIKRSMTPLEKLSTRAIEISTGEGLETAIKPQSIDEVGKMAKSLDRLRASLKAAMERLGE